MKKDQLKQLIREEIKNVLKTSSKKSLKEGYAWERGERKFGDPLPTLASVQSAYQAKQKAAVKTEASIPVPGKPGVNVPLRMNRPYEILDAGTNEWNEYKYLGEIGQGSTAGNPGEYMFYATDAPEVYIFMAVAEEDLKTMVKPL